MNQRVRLKQMRPLPIKLPTGRLELPVRGNDLPHEKPDADEQQAKHRLKEWNCEHWETLASEALLGKLAAYRVSTSQ